mmetsp:Transcript_2226/g.2543  ORF Transcript_2226/g.2543 Transcript_2226/m.2543 type:complete len:144 (+) Transcript_2226:230-661(+)
MDFGTCEGASYITQQRAGIETTCVVMKKHEIEAEKGTVAAAAAAVNSSSWYCRGSHRILRLSSSCSSSSTNDEGKITLKHLLEVKEMNEILENPDVGTERTENTSDKKCIGISYKKKSCLRIQDQFIQDGLYWKRREIYSIYL